MLFKLLLALCLGLLAGLERERRGKEAGVRTFAFVAVTGCVATTLGDAYAIGSLVLLVPLIVFTNIDSLKRDGCVELTTSAALALIQFVGFLCGKGQIFAPVALGLVTTGLLAWKRPIAGFSSGITEPELRSAILLGILAFVVYPVLPSGSIDSWGLVQPKSLWVTVLLVASIGFANYVLLRAYGSRGVELSGFLAGLVSGPVAVTELATEAKQDPSLSEAAFRAMMLAVAATLLRNAALLAVLAPACLSTAGTPLLAMTLASLAFAVFPLVRGSQASAATPPMKLKSPFSLPQAFKFALLFLAVSVVGTVAQRLLGSAGFYAVSGVGGLASSASSVASAAQLFNQNQLSALAGGIGAAVASIASILVNPPIVAQYGRDPVLTRKVMAGTAVTVAAGILATAASPAVSVWVQEAANRLR